MNPSAQTLILHRQLYGFSALGNDLVHSLPAYIQLSA
jgi:hypothetical protein